MLLHCQRVVAKKRSIALNMLLVVRTIMVQDDVGMVAGDFNGASWRRKSGPDQQFDFDSPLKEAFKNTKLLVPPGSTPLWGP